MTQSGALAVLFRFGELFLCFLFSVSLCVIGSLAAASSPMNLLPLQRNSMACHSPPIMKNTSFNVLKWFFGAHRISDDTPSHSIHARSSLFTNEMQCNSDDTSPPRNRWRPGIAISWRRFGVKTNSQCFSPSSSVVLKKKKRRVGCCFFEQVEKKTQTRRCHSG